MMRVCDPLGVVHEIGFFDLHNNDGASAELPDWGKQAGQFITAFQVKMAIDVLWMNSANVSDAKEKLTTGIP
jgi:hypothetical protein